MGPAVRPFLPLILAVLCSAPLLGLRAEERADSLLKVQRQVQSVLPGARKALVCLECNGATASGVIVSADGLVLTAAHVTAEPKKKVRVVLSDGRSVEGTSLGLDTSTDAAMVRLPKPAREWPHVSISRDLRALEPGQWCFDLGHPGGFDKARGSVVRIGRLVKISSNMLQSDCIMMGGDSGGPLFNLDGDVIGINSQIWSGSDQNLHVSMAPFLRSWDAMKRGDTITTWAQGGGGWVGISTEGAEEGLLIGAVAPDSPAMKAGLKQGDVIVKVNNQKLAMPSDFTETIRNCTVGQIVTLLVKTMQGQRVVEVKLGQRPEE